MKNQMNIQGFINAVNQMKQLPQSEWAGFVQNLYQSQNKNYTEAEAQAQQFIKSNNPQLAQFANAISQQFGIKF